MKYKIIAPGFSGMITTNIVDNTIGSRGVKLGFPCEVVSGTDENMTRFSQWWMDNVKLYCTKRGWDIEEVS